MNNRKLKFTAQACAKLEPPNRGTRSTSIEYTDIVSGLKLAVTSSGCRTFWWRRQRDGKKFARRIGDFPGISLEEARATANEFDGMLDRGQNPQEERRQQQEAPTFAAFASDTYLPYAQQRKRSIVDDESKLRLHLKPRFGNFKLAEIKRYEIELYIAEVAEKNCKATANRHLSLLSRMFNLAMGWGQMTANPCAGIKKFPEKTEVGRDFKPEQLAALRQAIQADSNHTAALALEFLLFTGLRLKEALNLRWENVDLDDGRIFLKTTKAGKPRYVTLNKDAQEILLRAGKAQASTDSAWVFPGTDPKKPLNTIQKPWRRALKRADLGHARVHDLRHQFATAAARAGVSLYQIQGLLGHATSVTTQRYAHLCDDSQREASEKAAGQLSKTSN